jgi:hypothetical protein
MKKFYLFLAIIGFIAPNILVYMVSVETGNILLWMNPTATVAGMFANRISAAFIIDLLIVVFVFFIWSHTEATRYGIKHIWVIWLLTMLFGMAGSFPLFLYFIEVKRQKNERRDKKSSHRKKVDATSQF